MEEHFLNDFVSEYEKKGIKLGSQKDKMDLWYNNEGDCIQFQADHVAVIADRIDEYLTIYRSAESNEPIGFQLKDVKALINKYGFTGVTVKAAVKNNTLVSVYALLLRAFEDLTTSINRVEGYTKAFRALPKEANEVAVPV